MAHVITLTGPAHCGKSTIRQMFMDCATNDFKPIMIKKYTTREKRESDDDVECMDRIPRECNLVYEQYGVRYGMKTEELYRLLEEERTPIVVVNDIRAVEDIKSLLGSLVYSIFMYRKPALYDEFYKEEKERYPDKMNEDIEKNARVRYEKAQAIYRIYIENINLFDKVILNTFSESATRKQVECIANQFKNEFLDFTGNIIGHEEKGKKRNS